MRLREQQQTHMMRPQQPMMPGHMGNQMNMRPRPGMVQHPGNSQLKTALANNTTGMYAIPYLASFQSILEVVRSCTNILPPLTIGPHSR
jgi:hypothetical protein